METITFFGNYSCPFCAKVLNKLKETDTSFEFNEVPMDRNVRGNALYTGENESIKNKTFEDIFNGNISIPKMITSEGTKLMDSQDMLDYLDKIQ